MDFGMTVWRLGLESPFFIPKTLIYGTLYR